MTLTEAQTGRAKRRSRIYSGRIKKSIFGAGLQHPTIFLHLPKCGGTSLSEALYSTVPIQQRVGVIDAVSTRRAAAIQNFGVDDPWKCHDDLEFGAATFALREQFAVTHGCWETRLIHGHILLTDTIKKHFLQSYKLLTIMRDPVQRAISNYNMAINAGIASSDPEEWLDSDICRAHSRTYLRYLSGNSSVSQAGEAAALEQALKSLNLFDLIGFLEQQDKFLADFETQFGSRLMLHKYNQAPRQKIKLTPSQSDRLTGYCASDRQIYEQAKKMFGAN